MRWGERGIPIQLRRSVPWTQQGPTWRDAKPGLIEAALKRAQARPSGNWYVLAASSEVRDDRPLGRTIAGIEIVAWRTPDGRVHAGPGECPHLGAPLCRAAVHGGALVCRWHGLSLDERGAAGWDPFPAHDDGVLAWVRLNAVGGEQPLDAPVLPPRPETTASIDAVMTLTGRCEPEDVVANRLDPWHGAWFHPYSFVDLRVVEAPPDDGDAAADRFLVEVSFRISRRVVVPVLASFSCPEPRTVVMHILDGEGANSVVETHAVPLGTDDGGHPRTAVIEATIAHSDRKGFAVARNAAPAMRPLMRLAARRLWRDDLAYAERRYELRTTGRWSG
ncbi:MAG: Rieske 2Fe-2S domain-containing protein [Pseudonocardiaceae bacterium]|nr:Rieske 2Fe-2S domain-containing protein [Pseudonocardiaceae bacterium]